MDSIWGDYLEHTFPLFEISDLVIYTDQHRYWLADGLIQAGEDFGWKISIDLLDTVTDEHLIEIGEGIAALSASTLLVNIFSSRNPSISKLLHVFPLFTPPFNFQGYSLSIENTFPDPFLTEILISDIDVITNIRDHYLNKLGSASWFRHVSSDGNTIDFEIQDNFVTLPFLTTHRRNHVLFPGYEMFIEISNRSMNGVISVDRGIGEVWMNQELVDPFGRVDKHLNLTIKDGIIERIDGDGVSARRLETILSQLPTSQKVISGVSLGLLPEFKPTGLVEVDRLSYESITFSTEDRNLEFLCQLGELKSL